MEFLFRQRPGLRGMASLPPSVSQVPGKYLCFLVTRVNEKKHDRPRACDVGTNEVEGLHVRKRDARVLNAGLRSEQGQVEP